MLSMDVPGLGMYEIQHLVLDMNGTIAHDGRLIAGVADAIERLRPIVHVVTITADTRGACSEIQQQLGIDVHVIGRGREAQEKMDFIDELGADSVIAIGNGANDELMLRSAAVGIAVLGGEGCASAAFHAADVFVGSIGDALGLLIEPLRLIATLRR